MNQSSKIFQPAANHQHIIVPKSVYKTLHLTSFTAKMRILVLLPTFLVTANAWTITPKAKSFADKAISAGVAASIAFGAAVGVANAADFTGSYAGKSSLLSLEFVEHIMSQNQER